MFNQMNKIRKRHKSYRNAQHRLEIILKQRARKKIIHDLCGIATPFTTADPDPIMPIGSYFLKK